MQRGRSCPGPAAGVGFLAWPFEGLNVFLGVPAGPPACGSPAPQGALRRRHLWIREAGGTWRAGAQGGERRPRSAEGGPRLRGAGPVPRALHTPSQRELRVSPWGPRLSPGPQRPMESPSPCSSGFLLPRVKGCISVAARRPGPWQCPTEGRGAPGPPRACPQKRPSTWRRGPCSALVLVTNLLFGVRSHRL